SVSSSNTPAAKARPALVEASLLRLTPRSFESNLMLTRQLLDSTRGRIVTLLQHSALTVDDLASELGLTANGVRAHLTAMERDGVVQRSGTRAGTTRPSIVYTLAPEVEQLLSRAYIPLLTQLVRVFADELPAKQMDSLLRQA